MHNNKFSANFSDLIPLKRVELVHRLRLSMYRLDLSSSRENFSICMGYREVIRLFVVPRCQIFVGVYLIWTSTLCTPRWTEIQEIRALSPRTCWFLIKVASRGGKFLREQKKKKFVQYRRNLEKVRANLFLSISISIKYGSGDSLLLYSVLIS